MLTVLVTVAGIVLEGQSAMRAEIADLRAEFASFRKELRAENAAFRKELRGENIAFRKDLRVENAAFHKGLRAENAELRKELRAEMGEVTEQTAQLRDRVTRLEVLVGVVIERLMPGGGVADLTAEKLRDHP